MQKYLNNLCTFFLLIFVIASNLIEDGSLMGVLFAIDN